MSDMNDKKMDFDKTVKEFVMKDDVPEKISPENIKTMLDSMAINKASEEKSGRIVISEPEKPERRSGKSIVMRAIAGVTATAACLSLVYAAGYGFKRRGDKSILTAEDSSRAIFEISESSSNSSSVVLNDNRIDRAGLKASGMRFAESYADVYDYLQIGKIVKDPYYGDFDDDDVQSSYDMAEDAPAAAEETDGYRDSAAADGEAYDDGGTKYEESSTNNVFTANGEADNEGSDDYSDTYNQEEGVLEADIIKTDGKKIFYACSYDNNGINVVEVKDGKVVSKNKFGDDLSAVSNMYLYNNMIITVSRSKDFCRNKNNIYVPNCLISFYSKDDYHCIGTFTQSGDVNDVRLRDDGYLYCVSTVYNYRVFCDCARVVTEGVSDEIKPEEPEKYVPLYAVNGEQKIMECEDILISDDEEKKGGNTGEFINISAFDLKSAEPHKSSDKKTIVGTAGQIYCSYDNLYTLFGYDQTCITKFGIDGGKIVPKAGTKVDGYVHDQFSVSEYNGNLRVAVTITDYHDAVEEYVEDDDGSSSVVSYNVMEVKYNNAVYVLDENLKEIGRITDFGQDETIHSVNFQGNMAYIVTYEQTDPLFAIDFTDPKNPKITSELKMTGYSGFMRKWSDGKLFGFGESGDEDGKITGIKLSMFDNSDPNNLKEIDKVEIPYNNERNSYSYSTGLWDRKALLIVPEKNIIGIPFSAEEYGDVDSERGYGVLRRETRYDFYSFDNNKFEFLGSIKKTDNKPGYDMFEIFNRCVSIGDYVYAFSNDKMISASIKEPVGSDSSLKNTDSCDFEVDYNNNIYDDIYFDDCVDEEVIYD